MHYSRISNVANIFNTIRENKTLVKISEFTVTIASAHLELFPPFARVVFLYLKLVWHFSLYLEMQVEQHGRKLYTRAITLTSMYFLFLPFSQI